MFWAGLRSFHAGLPQESNVVFFCAQSEEGLYLEWAVKCINLRVFQGFSRSLDWSCGRKAHKAVRFCRSLPPQRIPTAFPKNHIAGLCLSPELAVDILNMYILGVVPLPGFQSPPGFITCLGSGIFQLKTFMCQKKNASWEGAKTPVSIFQKKRPTPWQVFYDEDDVWHFCSREEDSTCADQYSLPTTLRRRFQATNPEEWTCLTQEMEVWFRWCSLMNWVIFRFHLNFPGFLWVRCFSICFIDESGQFYGMPCLSDSLGGV